MPLQGGLTPPLHMAVELGHADVVRVLLASGADKEARDEVRDLEHAQNDVLPPCVTYNFTRVLGSAAWPADAMADTLHNGSMFKKIRYWPSEGVC